MNGNGSNYGDNAGLCGYMPKHFPPNAWYGLWRRGRAKRSSQIIVIGDTGYDVNKVPNYRPWGIAEYGYCHSKKANFIFLDGHVSAYAATGLTTANLDAAQ